MEKLELEAALARIMPLQCSVSSYSAQGVFHTEL